ncbi:MAG: type III pantothenate kinase [Chloroflexota bacterium]
MLLVLDIGNTNITLGWFRDGRLLGSRRAVTAPGATADELEGLVGERLGLDGLSVGDVTAIALVSVVPSLTSAIEQIASRRGLPVLVADVGTIPIAIHVDRPDEVGPDRLVNALAVARIYGAPSVVADFGTATTVDAVDAEGGFLGGAIAPGLDLGLEALAARTARLPRVALHVPDHVIGRDTISAIQAGTVIGYQALASGLIDRVRHELAAVAGVDPSSVRVVMTGGLSAARWADGVIGYDVIDPALTLKGLAVLHAEVGGGVPFVQGEDDPARRHQFAGGPG